MLGFPIVIIGSHFSKKGAEDGVLNGGALLHEADAATASTE